MINTSRRMGRAPFLTIAFLALAPLSAYAQGRGGGAAVPLPSPSPRAAAPTDLTGYWVSVVVEDWRYRMLTPPKGNYQGVPLNDEARKIADAWDPAKDAASGDQCKSYAAPHLMRMPGRIHITWQDDQTLKLDSDAGTQTRLFSFGAPRSQGGDWQGVSQASWDQIPVGRGVPPLSGSLKVVTTKLKPGYLRKNGVPFSANAVLTEYYDRVGDPNGDSYLVITATVEDPLYLVQPYLTATHFKKQADGAGWNPTPCGAQ
jgi:hypothetical protein